MSNVRSAKAAGSDMLAVPKYTIPGTQVPTLVASAYAFRPATFSSFLHLLLLITISRGPAVWDLGSDRYSSCQKR